MEEAHRPVNMHVEPLGTKRRRPDFRMTRVVRLCQIRSHDDSGGKGNQASVVPPF